MRIVGLLPALALLTGAAAGALTDLPASDWVLLPLLGAAWLSWWTGAARLTLVATAIGYLVAGLALACHAREEALHTPLRAALDEKFGGFLIDAAGVGGRHDPLLTRAILVEDATRGDQFTTVRARVAAVRIGGEWQNTAGQVAVTVGGAAAASRAAEWRAGRIVELPVTFRRPARYLNDGVPDFERDLALDGTTLFGSVKSGLLVETAAHGTGPQEFAARVRVHVRSSLQRWVGPHDTVSAAIVTAILIGDRTGLPDEVRARLQAAGTYHVIAISGGNIAILAGITLLLLLVVGVTGRPAALATIVVLLAYAQLVTSGASVWRATFMAALYLASRLLDHRTPPWHAMAIAAAIVVCVRPLDVRDVGFVLTFGATGALLEAARAFAHRAPRSRLATWAMASVAASLAAEIALLPVSAWTFSRVTSAGLLLNLIAVPLMGIVQIAGMTAVALDGVASIAAFSGWLAHLGARGLVSSAQLVDLVPWLTARVPPPPMLLVALYYVGLLAWRTGTPVVRGAGLTTVAICGIAIGTGSGARPLAATPEGALRLTVFDVGQGDASLVQFPDGASLLIDTGGVPLGGGRFDIGGRVLAPALWTHRVRRLDTLLLTHGDPDHIGGARAVIGDFEPASVWEGVPVPRHAGLQELFALARRRNATIEQRRLGDRLVFGGAQIRVLHPPTPDWERQRVRNDDSVVIEVVYGDVAILLPGDVGATVERTLIPRLTPARVRILKLAHHGSRTSSSRELLETWRPQIAIISAGRGNTFGHPAPEVIERLGSVGARVYRTDLHGQITVDIGRTEPRVKTYIGGLH